jgi:hypothetical protein
MPFPTSDWSWGYDGGNPVQRADRRVLIVKGPDAPPWILLADDLVKDGGTHTYNWLLHLRSNLVVNATSRPITAQGPSARLEVYFAHPEPTDLTVTTGAYLHGGADPATTRLVATTTAVAPRYCVALVPRSVSMQSPTYGSWTFDEVATAMTLDWGAVRDVAVHDPERALVGTTIPAQALALPDSIATDGALALVRHAASEVIAFTLSEGAHLHWSGVDLVTLSAEASATMMGETVYVSRADIGFRIWAPRATRVIGPEGDVPFVHNGDFVVDPTASDVVSRDGRLQLLAVAPNPVRGAAHFAFDLTTASHARLRIVNVRGAEVASLFAGQASTGRHRVLWDGRDTHGRRLAAGIYLAVLDSNGERRVRRFLLAR